MCHCHGGLSLCSDQFQKVAVRRLRNLYLDIFRMCSFNDENIQSFNFLYPSATSAAHEGGQCIQTSSRGPNPYDQFRNSLTISRMFSACLAHKTNSHYNPHCMRYRLSFSPHYPRFFPKQPAVVLLHPLPTICPPRPSSSMYPNKERLHFMGNFDFDTER